MIFIKVIALVIGLLVVFFCLLSMFPIIRVEGDSMYPTYKEDEILLSSRLFDKKDCKCGRNYIIYLKDDEQGKPYYIVKRLYRKRFSPDKRIEYYFLGDNREVSADSRLYGWFDSSRIVAVIIGKKGRR